MSQSGGKCQVADEADDADEQDAEDGHAKFSYLARLHDQITHPAVGGNQFSRDQNAKGKSEADP